jgi:rhodanese-related sulfurtransferase
MPDPLPLEIDVAAVKQMLDSGEDFLLLDVREPDEHALVHIQQARLIPMSQLRERLAELEPYRDQRIVVHCHHGGRSQQVMLWLRRQQFPQVQNMSGGIDAWSQQVDPALPRY